MDMKTHLLAALHEQLGRWEDLLAAFARRDVPADHLYTAPNVPGGWSIKDVVAHLAAWQQRSLARLLAARDGHDPERPAWLPADVDPEGNVEQVNDAIHAAHRDRSWPDVHAAWRDGFLRLLEAADAIPERDLLDGNRYPWLDGHALAAVLLGTYDHHLEHYQELESWLAEGEVS